MIGAEDAPHTYEYAEHFKILPAIHTGAPIRDRIKDGTRVSDGFVYTSDTNPDVDEHRGAAALDRGQRATRSARV